MAKRRQRDDVSPIASDLESLLSDVAPEVSEVLPSPGGLVPSTFLPSLEVPFHRVLEEINSLTEMEDGRRYDPTVGHPKDATGQRARIAAPSVRSSHQVFMGPRRDPVLVCVRRKSRREVLFAKRRTRGGGGGRRRTAYSNVRC